VVGARVHRSFIKHWLSNLRSAARIRRSNGYLTRLILGAHPPTTMGLSSSNGSGEIGQLGKPPWPAARAALIHAIGHH
jgi:hypothetical protein